MCAELHVSGDSLYAVPFVLINNGCFLSYSPVPTDMTGGNKCGDEVGLVVS